MDVKAKAFWVIGVLGVGALCAFLFLKNVTARPEPAIRTAQSFVDGLRSHELEQAYQLTTQHGAVGRSLEEFQGIVRQQWPGTTPRAVQFLAARPAQTYGNRLRRWWHGRQVDPSQRWLEFSVDGLHFQVREIKADDGGWKVDYFQSHAG